MGTLIPSNMENAFFGGLGQGLAAQQQAQGGLIQAGGIKTFTSQADVAAYQQYFDYAKARMVTRTVPASGLCMGVDMAKTSKLSLRAELQADVDGWLPKL